MAKMDSAIHVHAISVTGSAGPLLLDGSGTPQKKMGWFQMKPAHLPQKLQSKDGLKPYFNQNVSRPNYREIKTV